MTELDRAALNHLLGILLPDLQLLKDPYCIIGTSALVLHGLPLTATSVDILTSGQGAEWLANRWLRFHTNNKLDAESRVQAVFHSFRIWGCEVDVLGDMDVMARGSWKPVRVRDSITIEGANVATLSEMQRLLKEFNREQNEEILAMLEPHIPPESGTDTVLTN